VPPNPHDALFRFTFSQPEHAAALLKSNLPAAIAEQIEWSTLALEPGSFVDEQLAWRHSDLLFTVNLEGRETFIYLLIEHQSSPDPQMAWRVLRYVARLGQGRQ
jgi:predicted transposase/invertase (TIGR01784 family)